MSKNYKNKNTKNCSWFVCWNDLSSGYYWRWWTKTQAILRELILDLTIEVKNINLRFDNLVKVNKLKE
jgi:hypothetical protein